MFGPTVRRWLADEPAYANLRLKQRVKLLTRMLVVGLTVGLVVGLIGGLIGGLTAGLVVRLTVGLTVGLLIGLTAWLGIPNRTDWASRPQSTYKATRTLSALQLCLALLAIVLAFGLAGWLAGRMIIRSGAWLSYVLTTCWKKPKKGNSSRTATDIWTQTRHRTSRPHTCLTPVDGGHRPEMGRSSRARAHP